jgi:ankyrin repeat protein
MAGPDFNSVSERLWQIRQEWEEAAETGNTAKLAVLLESGIGTDVRHSLSAGTDTETLEWMLLETFLRVHYDGCLATALRLATIHGHIETVQFLIHQRVDINKKNDIGESALYHAISNNQNPIIALLVEAGAKLTLYEAALLGDVETIRTLLESDADINQELEFEAVAMSLVAAAREGHLAAVRLLLEQGVDANAEIDGFTPLILAVRQANREITEALLEGGADVNFIPFNGEAALLHARDREMSLLLLQHGAGSTRADQITISVGRTTGRL